MRHRSLVALTLLALPLRAAELGHANAVGFMSRPSARARGYPHALRFSRNFGWRRTMTQE